MGPARPAAVNECALQIIPSLILLFDGLKRAYAAKVVDVADEEDDEEESDIEEGKDPFRDIRRAKSEIDNFQMSCRPTRTR